MVDVLLICLPPDVANGLKATPDVDCEGVHKNIYQRVEPASSVISRLNQRLQQEGDFVAFWNQFNEFGIAIISPSGEDLREAIRLILKENLLPESWFVTTEYRRMLFTEEAVPEAIRQLITARCEPAEATTTHAPK